MSEGEITLEDARALAPEWYEDEVLRKSVRRMAAYDSCTEVDYYCVAVPLRIAMEASGIPLMEIGSFFVHYKEQSDALVNEIVRLWREEGLCLQRR